MINHKLFQKMIKKLLPDSYFTEFVPVYLFILLHCFVLIKGIRSSDSPYKCNRFFSLTSNKYLFFSLFSSLMVENKSCFSWMFLIFSIIITLNLFKIPFSASLYFNILNNISLLCHRYSKVFQLLYYKFQYHWILQDHGQ